MKSRKSLLAALRDAGFADNKPTLESVKAFIETENLILEDTDRIPVDVEKAWNTRAAISVDSEPEQETRVKAATKQSLRAEAGVIEKVRAGDDSPKSFFIPNMERKSFEAKAARGQTVIPDADCAELIGACFRVNTMKARGVDSWSTKSRDTDITKGLVTYDNAAGGYLVPPAELVRELIYNGEPTGVARQIANVVRMGGQAVSYPVESADISLLPVAENGSLQSITPSFGRVNLVARKGGGYIESTMEEMEDSAFNIGDVIMRKVRIAYDNMIDDAYFKGDGTSTYNSFTGLANSANISSVTLTGNAWSSAVFSDFLGAIGKLQGIGSGAGLSGVCSRQFAVQVLARLDTATSQFKTLFTMSPDMTGGDFMGIPIKFSQRMAVATAATTKSMYFGNFRAGSMVGEYRDLTIKPDPTTGLSTDSFRWWITTRYSINIHGTQRTDLTEQNIVALTT